MKHFLILASLFLLVSCGQTSPTPQPPTQSSSATGDSQSTSTTDEGVSATGTSSDTEMGTGGLGAPELPAIESSADLGYTGIFSFTGGNMQVIERRKGTVGSLTVKVLTDTNDLWTGEEVTTAPVTSSVMTDLDRDGREEVLVFLQNASGSFTHASVIGYERNVPDWKRFTSDALKPLYSEGMRWNDAFELHQWRLFQRFPYFRESDSDDSPNGGEKVIEYRLVETASGRTLRAVDFMRRVEYGEALWALEQVGTHEFLVSTSGPTVTTNSLTDADLSRDEIKKCEARVVRWTLKSDMTYSMVEWCYAQLGATAASEKGNWEYDFAKKQITFKTSEGNLTGVGFSVADDGTWTQISAFKAL